MERKYSYGILALIVLFTFFFTKGMLGEGYPNGGDSVSHYDLLLNTINALQLFLKTGELRFWNPDYYFGFPMFFFYAPLPYIFLALLSLSTGIDPLSLFQWSIVLLFSALPLVFYTTARLMHLEEEFSLGIALFSTALSSKLVFGVEYYSFFATGLFSQLWGIVFLPLAFAFSYRYFVLGKGKAFFPVFFLFLTFVSHLFVGIISALSVGILVLCCLLQQKNKKDIFQKAGTVFFFFLLSTSFFLIPYFLNEKYFGNITFDLDEKEQGYGFVQTIHLLFTGELLDYSFSFSRIPALTVLFFAGFLLSIFWNKFREKYPVLPLFLFLCFAFSILCIAGKASFHFLAKIPVLSTLQTFRFITLFHFIALFYIGIALWWIVLLLENFMEKNSRARKNSIVFVVLLIIAVPVFYERMETFQEYALTYTFEEDSTYWTIISALKENTASGRIYVTTPSGLFDRPQHLQALPLLTGNPLFASTGIGGHDSLSAFYSSLPLLSEFPQLVSLFAIDFIIDKKANEESLTLSIAKEPAHYFALVTAPFVLDAEPVAARNAIIAWLYSPASAAEQFLEITDNPKEQRAGTILLKKIQDRGTPFALYEKGDAFAHTIYGVLDVANNSPTATVFSGEEAVEADLYSYFQNYDYNATEKECGEMFQETNTQGISKTTVLVQEKSCFVLFKMTYHPEWKVFVDGEEKELLMLSPSFMGVAVEEGQHDITFSYKVAGYRILLVVFSIFSLMLLFFWRK